ncbi:MAG: hypothetical protein ACYSTY_03110 [Planctomycetota bacterium]|jgi:hypothetical protein
MPPEPTHLVCRVLLVAAIASVARPVLAQTDQGPVTVSPRRQLEFLGIEQLDAAITVEWRLDVDDVEDTTSRRDTEMRLREILELSSQGYLGHPNLVQLDLGGMFRFDQRWLDFEATGTDEQINETVIDWDAAATFLPNQKFPLTLYTRQTTSDVDRQFGASLEQSLREYGVLLTARSETFPTTIQAFRREQRQEDRFGGLDFDIDQNTVQADGRIRITPRQLMSWDFAYDDVDESGELSVPRSFERIEGNVRHAIDFGADKQHQLRSDFRYFNESGARDFESFRVNERLQLRHSPNLRSQYNYTFEEQNRPDFEQRLHEGTAFVRHQLFDSLSTFARAGASNLTVSTDNFDRDEVFGELESNYVKQVPGGRFFADVGLRLSHVDQSDRGVPIPVFDTSLTFDAVDLILIDRRNVTPGSIVVTDATGLITYVEGVDYTVLVLPDRVEIRRVGGGAIGAMETVLVDFELGPEPGGTIDTVGYGGRLRYTFDETFLRGLSFYTEYFEQDESRSEALTIGGQPENDFSDLFYGVEYSAWKIYLRVERQHRDSSLSSFDATRLEARYVERLGLGSALVLSAHYQELDRTDENLRTETTTFSGRWDQQLTDRLRMSLELQFQDVESDAGGDSQAFEQELDLSWQYRQTQVYAKIRNSYRDTDFDDTLFQTFIVGLRREF